MIAEERALLCLEPDCRTIRDLALTECPRCASTAAFPLWRWLQRKEMYVNP
jgi:hypothetical protein